jgi:HK97 family phage prohead protease
MPREIERRVLAGALELRAAGGKKTLVGYAALYDSESHDLGGFIEIIRAGAFDRALSEGQVVMARYEHETNKLLGKTTSGTLRVSSDAKGLRYEVDLPDTQAGRDVLALAERGDVSGSSFAFMIPNEQAQRWTKTADGYPLRELLDLDLIDVAPTANPAYPETTVSARALEKAKEIVMKPTENEAVTLRTKALARVMARRTPEQREQSYEDRMNAIYAGLLSLLGSPWATDDSWWCVEATFEDRVVIEMFRGARKLFMYPMVMGVDGVPRFGAPVEVQEQYVPATPDTGENAAPPAEEPRSEPEEESNEDERLRATFAV